MPTQRSLFSLGLTFYPWMFSPTTLFPSWWVLVVLVVLAQWFSPIKVHVNHLGISRKCRLWIRGVWGGWRGRISKMLPGDHCTIHTGSTPKRREAQENGVSLCGSPWIPHSKYCSCYRACILGYITQETLLPARSSRGSREKFPKRVVLSQFPGHLNFDFLHAIYVIF